MRRFVSVLLVGGLMATLAFAGELAGVQFPDQVTVAGKVLHLNGMGIRKKLWIKVYVAGLYLEHPTKNAAEAVKAEEVKRVVMKFKTNKATAKKMANGWQDGFEANDPGQVAALQPRIDRFKSFFGDMHVGDEVDLTMVPGEGTEVVINGEKKGVIEGDDFSRALLRVWLGPKPPSAKMKAGMLGQ